MSGGAVILCSQLRSNSYPEREADLAKLTGRYGPFPTGEGLLGDGFRVRSWQARGQDGGNGGGGDASKPPIFVLGDASVGVWNFRSCPEGTEDVHFPAAARFELCLPFPDLETANDSLTATNKYLTRLFVYVMLVPFAIELRPQKLVISSLGAVM